MKILVMKIEDINNYNSEKFIDSFKNIYEESKFITEHADKKRPFKNRWLQFIDLVKGLQFELSGVSVLDLMKWISAGSSGVRITHLISK